MRRLFACLIALTLFAVSPKEASAQSEKGLTNLEAAGRFTELVKEIESRLAAGEPADATLLGPLCIAYSNLKRYGALFECADKLDARVRGGDTRMKSDYPFAAASDVAPLPGLLRAQAYLELGDYEKSIEVGNRAFALIPDTRGIYTSIWPPVKYQLIVVINLAIAAALSGNADRAKEYRVRLENFSVGFVGAVMWRPMRANGLARVYMANRQYDKALELMNAGGFDFGVMRMVDAVNFFGPSGDSLTTVVELPKLFMLAKAQFETGKVADAKGIFDKLLTHRRLPELGEIYWLSLYERGRIAAAEGDAAGAIEYWRKAIEVIEEQRSSISTEASKIGFVGDKQAVYRGLIGALVALQRYPEAFDYVERSKSRALVDMLAKQKDFAAPAIDEAKVRELLARASQAEIDAASLVPVRDESLPGTQRSRTLALARQSITEAAPELASLVSVSSMPIRDIQAGLPEDEALIEYYYDEKSLFAFVLTRQGLQGVRLESGGLESDVRELRKAIQQPGSDAYLAPAQRLYARLIQPVEPVARKEKLIIVAHGALHYLPFAGLHNGTQFLIDKYSLRFLPSASVVKYIRTTKLAKPGGILAFGNPDLGDPKADLHFAQEEAIAVAQTVSQSKSLVRKEATESALRQYASGFQYLHFATHGEFDAQAPLQSALLMAKEGTSDGLLTVGKLYSMRLDADLVTLSACETGLGKIASGDDVIGLTRGFLYAGASTIVASLWQVDDRATAELMIRFYENLKDRDKREALRQAQLAARQKFPHPFFWAAFQLTGNAL